MFALAEQLAKNGITPDSTPDDAKTLGKSLYQVAESIQRSVDYTWVWGVIMATHEISQKVRFQKGIGAVMMSIRCPVLEAHKAHTAEQRAKMELVGEHWGFSRSRQGHAVWGDHQVPRDSLYR